MKIDEKVIYLKDRAKTRDQQTPTPAEIQAAIESGALEIANETLNFEKINLFRNKVSIYLPAWFILMPKEVAELKYPAQNRPEIIYTDAEDFAANVTFRHTDNQLLNEEIEPFRDTMKFLLTQMQPATEWLTEGVREDNSVSYFDFISPAIDGKIYNLMFFASLEEKALLCGFNCQKEKMDVWMPLAYGMMQTMHCGPDKPEKGDAK